MRAQRFPASESILIEFDDYCVIEFLNAANDPRGPLYIIRKSLFEKEFLRLMKRGTRNAQLRSLLYRRHDGSAKKAATDWTIYRKAHQGNWQAEVNRILLRRKITSRLY